MQFDYGGFFARNSKGVLTGTSWSGLLGATDFNGIPQENVRYDSPTFAGFSVSASWGEDDFWDVAARYAGEWNGIKVAAAAAYADFVSPNVQGVSGASAASVGIASNGALFVNPAVLAKSVIQETRSWQVGAYVEHVPTGLWLYGAGGTIDADAAPGVVLGSDSHSFYYVKAGLRGEMDPSRPHRALR